MPTKKLRKNKRTPAVLDFSSHLGKDILAFTTLKLVDFKLKEGDASLNKSQKRFLQKKIGIACDNFPVVRQVHGRRIIVVKRKSCLANFLGKADGFITVKENTPLTVRTADCLSIFIYDPRHKAIGLVHAGWKGSKKEIATGAVRQMKKIFKTNPIDLKVAFGPAIRSCCYEVGSEFKKYFPKEISRKNDRFYLDLPLVNSRQLAAMGVRVKNIRDCKICTCCDRRFFSYRRQGEKAGRMISLMMLR